MFIPSVVVKCEAKAKTLISTSHTYNHLLQEVITTKACSSMLYYTKFPHSEYTEATLWSKSQPAGCRTSILN